MATTTSYSFNASVSGPTDPSAAWTNDANAFDGNTATSANKAGITGGGFSSLYLGGFGTNAPSSHASIILSVRIRVYGSFSSGDGVGAAADIGGVQQGPQCAARTAGGAWGSYVTITKADGSAWTWPDLAGLGVRMWPDTTGGGGGVVSPNIHEAEIEVTYSSTVYNYPIMVGQSSALTATTLARYLPITETNDTAVDTNDDDVAAYLAAPAVFAPTWKLNMATAPGTGVTRNFFIRRVAATSSDTAMTFAIADPATSGNTSTLYTSGYSGDLFAIKTNATGGTPAASSGNAWRLQFQAERQQLWSTSLTNLSTTLVRYMGIQDTGGLNTTSAASAQQYMPEDGGIRNFTVYAQNAALTSGSYAIDLFINGSSVVTLTLDTSNRVAQDTGNTRTWTQGQAVYIQITPSGGTAPNAVSLATSGEYISSVDASRFILLSSNNTNLTTTNTNYNNWYGPGAWNTTEASVQALGASSTLVAGVGVLSADTGAAKTRTVTFQIGGSSAATLFTFNNSGTTKTYSGSVAVANDNLINVKQVPSGTPTNSNLKYGLVFTASPVANPSTGSARLRMMMGMGT